MIADPLTWLFAQMVRLRNARYDAERAPIRRLRLPVISVGNISVGGSGKTPFVQTLGRWLNAQEIAFDILSRGYGRSSQGVLQVDPAGPCSITGSVRTPPPSSASFTASWSRRAIPRRTVS